MEHSRYRFSDSQLILFFCEMLGDYRESCHSLFHLFLLSDLLIILWAGLVEFLAAALAIWKPNPIGRELSILRKR